MICDVYLVHKRQGPTHAHVPALVGCNWRGATPEQAAERAPAEIAAHLAWLRRHGLPLPGGGAVEPRLVRVPSSVRGGGVIGFFESDREPVPAAEVEPYLRQMACSRADLLALTQPLPAEAMERQPAERAWSIAEILRHVASAERWYLSRIIDPATLPRFRPEPDVWKRLEAVRALAVERLAALSDAERTAIVVNDGELWSARKVFRRFLEHEREHYAHVIEVLDALRHPHP